MTTPARTHLYQHHRFPGEILIPFPLNFHAK
jgi:hypothetical protein